VVLCCFAPACRRPPKTVAYDLADRLAVADRSSTPEVILFGTPAAEPHQAEGFFPWAGGAGDRYAWARREVEVALRFAGATARAAVADLAAFRGVKQQAVSVSLNGAEVARFGLGDSRQRYRVPLPASAQRAGDNRLRFVFASTASAADVDPRSSDGGQLAAAFYSLAVGAEGDERLDDLLRREAPRPFSLLETGGVPALVQMGPSVVRYAVRLPQGAELRFKPGLHPAARPAAGEASLRVTLESAERPGEERQVWARTLGSSDPAPEEIALPLASAAGSIVRLGLHVSGGSDDRFAWATWGAPRILGTAATALPGDRPMAPAENAKADPLRRSLAGTNVLLIVLDAARARQLSCYGYLRATTPEIDRIAAEGARFENAFTPAVHTLGAMSSLWTSQPPERHHSETSFSARLPADRRTLAELLSARGILAAGFVANGVAGAAFGFDRGFSVFREVFRETSAGSGAGAFREVLPAFWEANKTRRFFAYLHFREPHFPYDPPPPFDTRFGPDGPISKTARRDMAWITAVNQGRRQLSPSEVEHLVRLYDGNLAFADQEVGGIRRDLEALGLWERTVVILTADHGEALHEHGWIGHSVQLYDESIRVPLIVRLPKGPSGVRVPGLVDLLDVAPTVADVFGLLPPETSAQGFEGRSLLPLLAGAPGWPAVISRTIWDRPRYAIRDARFKLVQDAATGEEQLYDLERDPQERQDLRSLRPLVAAYYRQALQHWMARALLARRSPAEQARLSPEQCENLKALGYLDATCK
jgi:arylsulfatase A-like enzyme